MTRFLKHGVDYGINIVRNPIVSILCNLPIINLLYTKRLRFDVTYFVSDKDGHVSPATGTYRYVRVPLFAKNFRVIYSLDHAAVKAKVYVYSNDNRHQYPVTEKWVNSTLYPLVWYVSDFTIGKKVRH